MVYTLYIAILIPYLIKNTPKNTLLTLQYARKKYDISNIIQVTKLRKSTQSFNKKVIKRIE